MFRCPTPTIRAANFIDTPLPAGIQKYINTNSFEIRCNPCFLHSCMWSQPSPPPSLLSLKCRASPCCSAATMIQSNLPKRARVLTRGSCNGADLRGANFQARGKKKGMEGGEGAAFVGGLFLFRQFHGRNIPTTVLQKLC